MTAALDRKKQTAASLSVAYNLVAMAVKVAAAGVTGSVSLLSEAAHSATDIVASLISYFSVRAAAAPADDEHPYGHGKIESLAGLGESILLMVIVGYVVIESAQRLLRPVSLPSVDIGLVVMAVSAVSSFCVGLHVQKIGREANSFALQSNGQHLLIDAWTSVGVLVALAVVKITGWASADSVCGLIFAVWMGYGAFTLSQKAFHDLIDHRVEPSEVEAIERILRRTDGVLGFHKLRTRHSGSTHYIDVHVVVPRTWTVVQAHDLADQLEKEIETELNPAVAVIHIDPEPEGGLIEGMDPD